jgi:hypothetical protein
MRGPGTGIFRPANGLSEIPASFADVIFVLQAPFGRAIASSRANGRFRHGT